MNIFYSFCTNFFFSFSYSFRNTFRIGLMEHRFIQNILFFFFFSFFSLLRVFEFNKVGFMVGNIGVEIS